MATINHRPSRNLLTLSHSATFLPASSRRIEPRRTASEIGRATLLASSEATSTLKPRNAFTSTRCSSVTCLTRRKAWFKPTTGSKPIAAKRRRQRPQKRQQPTGSRKTPLPRTSVRGFYFLSLFSIMKSPHYNNVTPRCRECDSQIIQLENEGVYRDDLCEYCERGLIEKALLAENKSQHLHEICTFCRMPCHSHKPSCCYKPCGK